SVTNTHTPRALSLTHTHTHSTSLSLCLSSVGLSLSFTHTHTHTHTQTHTHTHTHTPNTNKYLSVSCLLLHQTPVTSHWIQTQHKKTSICLRGTGGWKGEMRSSHILIIDRKSVV